MPGVRDITEENVFKTLGRGVPVYTTMNEEDASVAKSMIITEQLLVESSDMRRHNSRTSYRYEYYTTSLEKYIPWMKEQISKSKEGFIRIKRGDLAIAMKKELAIIMGDKYRDITFNSLYNIIRIVLFNEGIFVELSHYDGERVFMMRNRMPNDCLMPGLIRREKEIKGT